MTIISTLLEEVALVAGVLWGLPRLGVLVPLWVLIIVMAAWCAYTVVTYRMGSRALKREPIPGLLDMQGSQGRVVSPLALEGLVRIRGELWMAKSSTGRMDTGEQIIVVGQEGLKLIVRKA